MAKLTTGQRNKLPASKFAGPDRSYPIPDKAHAANAKARAAQQVAKGNLSKAGEQRIDAKANRVLGEKPAAAKRPTNPEGNPGHHPSTRAFEHAGYKHSSEDR